MRRKPLHDPVLISNNVYLFSAFSAYLDNFPYLSVMILISWTLSFLYHYSKEQDFHKLDVKMACTTVGYALWCFIVVEPPPPIYLFVGVGVFTLGMFCLKIESYDDRYDLYHTLWHLLSGLSIIILCH